MDEVVRLQDALAKGRLHNLAVTLINITAEGSKFEFLKIYFIAV